MICMRCGEREAAIHSHAYKISLCDECTREILQIAEEAKRNARAEWNFIERIVPGKRR